MKKRRYLFGAIFILIFFAHTLSLTAATPYMEGDFIIVEASGQGRTLSEARIQARRNAAQLAVGFAVNGNSVYPKTHGEQGRLIEQVVSLTRGIIGEREEEISRREAHGKHTVTLRVKVRGSELLSGLLSHDSQTTVFDGTSIAARAIARDRWEKDVGDALIEVIGTFPFSAYVNTKTTPRENTFNPQNGSLEMNLWLSFDRKRYFNEAVPQLITVLDYVADAKRSDIPCILPITQGNDGQAIVTPPLSIETIATYMSMMELENGNRYIDSEGGGFANIYIMTKDYYFNAYRVHPSAFVRLVESIFTRGQQGQLSQNQERKASLKIDFLDRNGNVSYSLKPIDTPGIRNIMLFMDGSVLKLHPWNVKKHGPIDEPHHALFILPAIGTYDEDNKEYKLFQEIKDSMTVTISAESLVNLGKGTTLCRLNFE